MPKNKELKAFAKSLHVSADEIVAIIRNIKQQKAEKERLKKEEERAGRTEERAERRLGLAERGEQRGIAAEGDVKTQERMDWAGAQQARLSPAANTIANQSAAVRGGAVADVQGQALAGMKTGQDVNKGLLDMQLDTYKASQLLGEEKKEEEGEADLATLIKGLPEPARSRIQAQIAGLDVKSSREAYPGAEAEADDKPPDEWYRNKIISLLTKINPATQSTYTEEDVIRMLRLSPEQVQTYFGRTEGGVGQGEGGTLATATGLPTTISEQQPNLSVESQPAPMDEDYNPADHIPAGDTMPVAGELIPEKATLGTAVLSEKLEQVQGGEPTDTDISPNDTPEQIAQKILSVKGTLSKEDLRLLERNLHTDYPDKAVAIIAILRK